MSDRFASLGIDPAIPAHGRTAGFAFSNLKLGTKEVRIRIFGGEYKYSPMSALYVYGRPQDLSLQKARDTIHLRNHLRLWASPWKYQGKRVWVGGISREVYLLSAEPVPIEKLRFFSWEK